MKFRVGDKVKIVDYTPLNGLTGIITSIEVGLKDRKLPYDVTFDRPHKDCLGESFKEHEIELVSKPLTEESLIEGYNIS